MKNRKVELYPECRKGQFQQIFSLEKFRCVGKLGTSTVTYFPYRTLK